MDQIDRVDARLREMNRTWADLGRAIGASAQRMTNWKAKDRRAFPRSVLPAVARFLNRPVDWILSDTADFADYMVCEALPDYGDSANGRPGKLSRAAKRCALEYDALSNDGKKIIEIALEIAKRKDSEPA